MVGDGVLQDQTTLSLKSNLNRKLGGLPFAHVNVSYGSSRL